MSVLLNIPDCYQFIIGLSRTQCECYTPPIDADESLSGLYIDELESLAAVTASVNCENGNDVFDQYDKARAIAITTFQADTNALMLNNFKLKRNNFSGAIGRAVYKNVISQTTGQWYGVRMYCDNVKSGVLVIKNIGTMFDGSDTILLHIYNNLGEEVMPAFFLNTLANKHQKNTVDITLPLHSPYIQNLEYYFIYEVTTLHALNNDLKCNCGGFKPYYNTQKPYFRDVQHDRNYMWSTWLMAGGYHSDTLPDFGLTTNLLHISTNFMYGLTFEVELKCKIDEVLCYESLDFESNMLARAMAIAIQHKAASILASWVINSGNLNRFTLINTEQMIEDIKKWDKIYSDMITYIATEVDITTNDCLACRDIWEMAKHGILA